MNCEGELKGNKRRGEFHKSGTAEADKLRQNCDVFVQNCGKIILINKLI